MSFDAKHGTMVKLRSQIWFDNPDDPDMTALYIERYLNWGITREELQSGKPLIGIAQSGSDLSPCNRQHIVLAKRVREGIREAGGIAFEFPVHPIQETGKRPTANLDRNLAYLGLVETLFGYPLDGCGSDHRLRQDHAGPADGGGDGEHSGNRTVGRTDAERLVQGPADGVRHDQVACQEAEDSRRDRLERIRRSGRVLGAVARILQHHGHGHDDELAGRGAGHDAARIGRDPRRPQGPRRGGLSDGQAHRGDGAGGSEAVRHHDARSLRERHRGLLGHRRFHQRADPPQRHRARTWAWNSSNDDWEKVGHSIPLLVDMQPAGRFLGEDFYRAGSIPAVVAELIAAGRLPHPDAKTVNGKTIGENCTGKFTEDREVIRAFDQPMLNDAGFLNLKGNLFDSAIMKTSVISPAFRERYLSDPKDPEAFEGRAVVFDGRDDYHDRINDPSLEIDEHSVLFIRGAGPIGHPGAAEVVNMDPPAELLKRGITELPCIGDGRQSGTSGSPSILNASPEAAVGGGLALVRTGDRVRIDLNRREANILISDQELAQRREEVRAQLANGGLPYVPESQTPWQEIQRSLVDQYAEGMVLKPAVKYHDVAHKYRPRDNH